MPSRRPRYSGKYPRKWEEKYKEHRGDAETLRKVAARGKTAAGTHRPIMVAEILEALQPQPGEIAVDATLGYGGHAAALLPCLLPGGKLIALDADPLQLPVTEARLREMGFGAECFVARRSNFAGLGKVLAELGLMGVDCILADLGVSSMQIDNPARGFSFKHDGPLDMRMNPSRGQTAADFLAKTAPEKLQAVLEENADETHAALLAERLAGRRFDTTLALAREIAQSVGSDDAEMAQRRVFQALRIAVNDEFSALDRLLAQLPALLNAGGRAAILTFHSGEDRRVKKAFAAGFAAGIYEKISREVIRPTRQEQHDNPRSCPAKLRWAVRSVKESGATTAG